MPDLTICSAYHKEETRDLLSLNWKLTTRLNEEAQIRWLVTDNSPRASNLPRPQNMEVFDGFEIADFERMYAKPIVYAFHASSALNNLVSRCRTRYVLFLDADFFVVRPGWVREIISHMQQRSLAAFGAPWHPQYSKKLRYYPAQAFVLIDTSRIPAMEIDFHPDYPFAGVHLATNPTGEFPPKRPRRNSLVGRIRASIEERIDVGTSKDVSYRVARLLEDSGMPIELVLPVWKPADQVHALHKAIDGLVPERFSLTPKRPGYFSETGFKEHGRYDFYADSMEEYMWRDEPFSVHIRNTTRRGGIDEAVRLLERQLLKTGQSED